MSENQDIQVQEEKHLLKLFRDEYDEFPKGKIIKSESPDFILKMTPKKSIGIELTKLHSPLSEKVKYQPLRKGDGYHTPEISRKNIDFTIKSKVEKLYLYQRKKNNQIWLLITADLRDRPIPYNLSNQLSNWKFDSKFDKIFLMELSSQKVFELI